jgi:hypothetical protein
MVKLQKRALIWDAVACELGISYEPDEDAPGDTAIYEIREMRSRIAKIERERDALQARVTELEAVCEGHCINVSTQTDPCVL